jgi:hypothetical protein
VIEKAATNPEQYDKEKQAKQEILTNYFVS